MRSEAARHPQVTMLLDNEYGPDRRVEFEARLLREAGISVRILAWDRRAGRAGSFAVCEVDEVEVVRLRIPAPRGGGWRSLLAMLRFARGVWNHRQRLFAGSNAMIVHDIYLLPLGWLISRRLGLPFVYDAHEEYARMEAGRYPAILLQAATRVENALARSADAILVPGLSRTSRWTAAGFEQPLVLRNTGVGRVGSNGHTPAKWDLIHAGTISDGRRLDILLDLARSRPDLKIVICGRGKSEDAVAAAAAQLSNVDYLGWQTNVDRRLAQSRAIYYGLDPDHPDAETACPNTLYQGLLHEKPLIYFCTGEIDEIAQQFRIGIHCQPTAVEVGSAIDTVKLGGVLWQFREARHAVVSSDGRDAFVAGVRSTLAQRA
jgi:glycosyltransferase involved in cell wall biosynthesis